LCDSGADGADDADDGDDGSFTVLHDRYVVRYASIVHHALSMHGALST